ncbi:two-component sensor histidine kinase, partial [Roseomonas oryzicola]|nr:two-component sensor histidine kinase [Neoroseomonas oryzicola]
MTGEAPRPVVWLRSALVVAGVPAVALLVLMATGELAAAPGLVALAVTLAAGAAVARIWLGAL